VQGEIVEVGMLTPNAWSNSMNTSAIAFDTAEREYNEAWSAP
jgi:hypothetical protein